MIDNPSIRNAMQSMQRSERRQVVGRSVGRLKRGKRNECDPDGSAASHKRIGRARACAVGGRSGMERGRWEARPGRVCVWESGAGGQGLRTDVWFRNGKARAAKPGPSVEYSSCTPGAALRDPAQQCPAFDAIKVAVEHGHYGFAGVRGPTPIKIHVYLRGSGAKPEPTVSTGWPRRKRGEGGRRDGRRRARRSVR